MDIRVVLGIICLMLDGIHATQCDNDSCLQVCQQAHLNGTCNAANKCECSFGHTCSTMANTCEVACKILKMEGECDENDICQCSATPEWCAPTECQESCQTDPRAAGCLVVEAVGCVEYGPITFCQCMCYQWRLGMHPIKQWSSSRETGTSISKKTPEVLKI